MSRTKQQLEQQLGEVATRVSDLLNPTLSREAIVEELQAIDEELNSEDEEDDDNDEDFE